MKKAANKEHALPVIGLLMIAAGALLMIGGETGGEMSVGVAILLGILGAVLIAVRKKFG